MNRLAIQPEYMRLYFERLIEKVLARDQVRLNYRSRCWRIDLRTVISNPYVQWDLRPYRVAEDELNAAKRAIDRGEYDSAIQFLAKARHGFEVQRADEI